MTKSDHGGNGAYVAVPSTPTPPSGDRTTRQPPLSQLENPLARASLLSVVSAHWMQPLISLGATKVLEPHDVWRVCERDTCDALEQRFETWYEAHDNEPTTDSWVGSRFGRALLRTFRRDLAIAALSDLVYLVAMALQPFLTQAILNHLADRDNVFHVTNGYVIVVLMTSVAFICATCINYGGFVLSRVGTNMRSVVMNAVYQKALTLSSTRRASHSTGQILTHVSVDAQRVFSGAMSFLWLALAPLAFVITCVLIAIVYDVVAAALGAVLLVGSVIMSVDLAHRIRFVQGELLGVVQERVKVTSEALQGIRVVKLYAWEEPLAQRVERLRTAEVKLFRKFHFLSILNSTLLLLTPLLLGALVLGVYVWRNGTISVADAFTLISMVGITRLAVSLLPMAIVSCSQARAGLQRIDAYMESPGLEKAVGKASNEPSSRGSIILRNASFEWAESTDSTDERTGDTKPKVVVLRGDEKLVLSDDGQESKSRFSLKNIDLQIEAGSLVMIVGPVGAGKTALLHAILGEMTRSAGVCDVHGEISYVSQEPWIRNASVQDNINFEAEFDRARYEQVVEATQLTLDLQALPHGDQTEIGERGINLSGGQKARVAIARAMYRHEYDILVIDDPLSAVDTHVAHGIFNEYVMGLASQKTRLVALNGHYDLLVHADQIVVIQNGCVVGNGSFHDIITQFPDLDVRKRERDEPESHTQPNSVTKEDEEVLNSVGAIDDQAKPSQKPSSSKLTHEEDRVQGRVSGSTYYTYFDEAGFNGLLVVIALVILYAASQGLKVASDYWQGYWAKQMPRKAVDPSYSQSYYLAWYFSLVVMCAVLTLARSFAMIEACMRSAKNIHNELFRRVLRAPVNRYFDITPVGRVLNRFSNDLDQVDASLPQQYDNLVESVTSFFGGLLVCAFASAWIAVSYLPLLVAFAITGLYFKRSSREIKRLEGVTRTPIFNLFGETLNGLVTIRAFKMQHAFTRTNKRVIDENASFYFHFWAASRWLAVRLDWLSVLIVLAVSVYVVASKDTISPVVAGLAITYAFQVTSMVQRCVRAMDITDNTMTSVERLFAFRDIPIERDDGAHMDAGAWPSVGEIVFDAVCLRYRPELPLVLRGVNLAISGGRKIGVCGRTGAGKSSLMAALFRICELDSGTVRIDGVDISTLQLRDLRRALAIIPQDPVLFSGSLRANLDPFVEFSDEEIWHVLTQVHLAERVVEWGHGLDFEVSERGDNLSMGQRQLLCIGRALLKDSKIVVLDEATASVDTATDRLIQATILETFQNRTVLIIAHRIQTILHCDSIAVIEAGQVAEFGAPSELLAHPESCFALLTKHASS